MSFAAVTSPRRERLVRFFLVGATAASVQLLLLWILEDVVGLHHLVAAFLAIESTILLNYVLNNAWTFARSQHVSRREYAVGMGKTNLVRGTAMVIQIGVFQALLTLTMADSVVAMAAAILLTAPYRYVLDASWTWN
jgi:putative flippase GtrA